MIVFSVYVDVYRHVFVHENESVYCLTFLWMFIIPFSQCIFYLLCMYKFMCLFMYAYTVYVYVDVYHHVDVYV